MPLMHDEDPPHTGSTNSLPADLLTAPVAPRGQGPATRSSSPSVLSGELVLRVNAQGDHVEALEDMISQLSELGEDVALAEIEMMAEQLDDLHSTFKAEHAWLLSHWPPAHLDHPYFNRKVSLSESKLVFKAKRLLGRHKDQLTQAAQPPTAPEATSRVRSRLPELTVPKFSGESRKWPDFKAMFLSVIGTRADLSDLEKFQYLKAAMEGDASELIVNLTPEPEAYHTAWLLLTARFENKRLIIKSHLERLLALKPMTKRQASSLTRMVNIVNQATQAFRTLTDQSNNDCLMVTLVSGLLDSDTRERWESSLLSSNEFPTLTQLTDFLLMRARTLEALEEGPQKAQTPQTSQGKGAIPKRSTAHHAAQASASKAPQPAQSAQQTAQPAQRTAYPCDSCGQEHFVVTCPQFRSASLEQRVQLVKDKSLCCNCLGRHNWRKPRQLKPHQRRQQQQRLRHEAMARPPTHQTTHQKDSSRKPANSRCWQQPQPTSTHLPQLISLAQQLNLQRRHSRLAIYGVGGGKTSQTKGVVSLTLHARYRPLSITIQAHILSTVTTVLPTCETTHEHEWPHLKGLKLADPEFLIPRPIDIIVGAESYGQLIKPNIIRHSSTAPIAQLSIFGWLVLGPVSSPITTARITHHGVSKSSNASLQDILTRFWIQEEPPESTDSHLTPEEQQCENYFETTHSRDESGRYVVRLPLKSSPSLLGNSYQTAHHCLQRILKRLAKDTQYGQLYTDFMREYEQSQHMNKCNSNTLASQSHYYLPHHGVLKPESATTKLRVVFNGSSATSTGCSLNDLMHTGPNLMLNIFDLLIWIRRHRYLFATDITKMYRQIKVHPADWDLQRVLWIDEQGMEAHYQLTTVTYGTKAAPFLAVRTLIQLAKDEGTKYPLAVEPITHGRYVDDIFGGSDSVENLIQTASQLTQLCHAGGFPLAKWHSTSKRLLEAVSSKRDISSAISFDDCSTKILGIRWSPPQDTFNFSTISSTHSNRFSKRLIFSEVAQLFDPLGFAAPVVIRAKMFLQELWLHKLNWDDSLPEQLISQWLSMRHDLTSLARLSIPRWFNTLPNSPVELHGFSDASHFAMAAVVYLVVHSPSTGANVSLICSKTKVSPLKRLTIPRLELTAALLLSTLTNHVYATLNMNITKTHLWTDSQVTLSWIKAHPSRWKDYVRNRVTKIQELTEKAHWRHIPGTSNPADCASRGITTDQLEHHHLWWSGPPWITQPEDSWPTQPDSALDDLCAQEVRASVLLHATHAPKEYRWDLIHRFSSLNKLLRITALCVKFTRKLSRRFGSVPTPLVTSTEMENARLLWIKATQEVYFQEELALLKGRMRLPVSNPLCKLTAFIDGEGVLRVGGRLNNAELSYNARNPAILPRSSRFSELIIAHAHQQTMHGGTQSTLTFIRQLVWIIGGRIPVKSHILRCVVCARHRGIRAQQLMGQLPLARVAPSRPFSHTGIDYAGPLTLKTWKGRGSKTHKGWISVFACLTTSATHLELVSDYSTEAFIATYKRFVSRRGIPSDLYSDCGTNFLGADAQFKKCFNESSPDSRKFSSVLAHDKTQWHFNPPAAPHMGGKWEAAVKSVKFHLKRTVGDTPLTYEETSTLLTQIEAILNSRPLEPLSDDPDDTTALTPGHFLIGTALNAVPEPSLLDVSMNRLSRWQFIQQRVQQFWHSWSTQYLQRLQAISKWHHPHNDIQVGSLVLLTDERLPPGKWPMARVLKLLPGKDGLTRVVSLKTATTTLTRPIAKLATLPVTSQ